MKQLLSVSDGTGARKTHRKIRIGEMTVHKMKFVVVNNMAPRNTPVCAERSRPLERGYLHDLSTSKRYCGIECYPNTAETAVKCADHNPLLSDQATKTLENALRRE